MMDHADLLQDPIIIMIMVNNVHTMSQQILRKLSTVILTSTFLPAKILY